MNTIEDTVKLIIKDFIANEVLFTALDVSNIVKQTIPTAKHRNVREVVRSLFTTDIEGQGWARTPITVNLADGTTAEALLYHPLTDSWDLDNKYNTQARQATSYRPAVAAAATVAAAQAQTTVPASTLTTTAPASVVTAPPAPAPTPAPAPSPRDQWSSLFQTQPSLFPKR